MAGSAAPVPRRVLFLVAGNAIGGTERMVCGLHRQFSAKNWHVRTIFPAGEETPRTLQWCREQGVEAESSPAVRTLIDDHLWRDVVRLRRLIREARPDVVNFHYGGNFISLKDVLAVRAAGGARLVVTVNHPTPWRDTETSKRTSTGIAGRLAHAVVAISHATQAILKEAGVGEKKITIIPCGLPVPPRTFDKREARKKLGLPEDEFIVGALARLEPTKGVDSTIRALSRLPGSIPFLAVGGVGPAREDLQKLAGATLGDRARFLGRVEDVNEFYAACDVYCLPSRLEGFGLVYVEAAFNGVPSIAANTGGVPDAITDGETGILVPVGDVPALINALRRLRDDAGLRERMGNAARARARTDFTEAIMANRYEALFDHVLKTQEGQE